MKCRECGAEVPAASPFCGRCRAPVPERSAAQEPGTDFDGIAKGTAAQSLAEGRQGLRIAAVVMAFIGATLIIWASTLPVVIFNHGSSVTSMSLFSVNYSNAQVASLEPVVAGILAVSAAVILITAGSRPRRPWLAAGILLASGFRR
jgi:hypothetical protein